MGELWVADLADELRGGDAAALGVHIDEIVLAGGSIVRGPAPGVTAVVGGNNAGKSTLLRNTRDLLARDVGGTVAGWRLVESLTLTKSGSGADCVAWLGEHAHYTTTNQGGFFTGGRVLPARLLGARWDQLGFDRLGALSQFFVQYADAQSRLGLAAPAGRRGDISEPPAHPLHYLEDNEQLLRQMDELSREIFQQPLTLDRLGGNVGLRVGTPTVAAPPVDAVTQEYREALIALPHLQDQGDGMRSLLGLLLPVVTATHQIILVDEPEAFLHPPQARALGRALARIAVERGLQIVL